MNSVWICAAGLCGATIIGSILGFLIKEIPHKWNDTILGYCAGVMLAASTIGLILPAFEARTGMGHYLLIIYGVMMGAFFLSILDMVTPHLHHITGIDAETHNNNAQVNRVLLFVLAIALHKLPEGLAAGVSMAAPSVGDGASGFAVSLGIALQNVPEGMVIIAPLLLAGVKPMRTFIISLVIGLLEVVGVWLGYGLGSSFESILPMTLAISGGAMLYVTSDEMIPETHAHGYQKQATYALLLGFMTLLLIEHLFE